MNTRGIKHTYITLRSWWREAAYCHATIARRSRRRATAADSPKIKKMGSHLFRPLLSSTAAARMSPLFEVAFISFPQIPIHTQFTLTHGRVLPYIT